MSGSMVVWTTFGKTSFLPKSTLILQPVVPPRFDEHTLRFCNVGCAVDGPTLRFCNVGCADGGLTKANARVGGCYHVPFSAHSTAS